MPVRGRYFYQRRDGRQNQPVLYVRDGVDGADRVARRPQRARRRGHPGLDWYYPSEDGRLLAYGLSENGSEQSVLHLLDVDTGHAARRPDPAHPLRRPRVAPRRHWLLLHPLSRRRRGSRGEEHYHRVDLLSSLGADPAADPLVFRPALKEYWPGVSLSPDGRWLLIGVVAHLRRDRPLPRAIGSPGRRWCRWRRTCRRRSRAKSPTGACSSAPISTRPPTGCMPWTRNGPRATRGAS